MEKIKLTQYSHGAGCGCKIAPAVLENILKSNISTHSTKNLLVGNNTKDDAAVYDIGNGKALISTVDFFMPIVDDAFDFGKIASANAISDVYAMGGKPILATAILGWPVNKLPVELAQKVLDGAKTICNEAGIPLAGGHSIDTLEPMFGLSVNGLVDIKNLKQNSTAKNGDLIYITKKIGVGILATALKRDVIKEEHKEVLINQLTQLNKIGESFGDLPYVTAMTDITGFGLLGHLIEMAEGAGLSAELNYSDVPVIDGLQEYISKMIVPDNAYRNWNSFEKKVSDIGAESFFTLCDPQTNGGLMITVSAGHQKEFENFLSKHNLIAFAKPIGKMTQKTDFIVSIK
ncbi:MAG TPA: selenide, water dikinase SelD [Bacteroidia bacterium]|jgi:selenide,water dikinase|nr:selenide, water dikinase SelD [Bacteroidia bacterium]